jgi:hypothetical protein
VLRQWWRSAGLSVNAISTRRLVGQIQTPTVSVTPSRASVVVSRATLGPGEHVVVRVDYTGSVSASMLAGRKEAHAYTV